MKLKLKDGTTSRVATAALMGKVSAGTSICPEWLAAALSLTACDLTALASDNIDLATGRGSVKGKFSIVVQDTNAVDGSEFVIVEGSLNGTIDLSLAVLGLDGVPFTGDEIPLGGIGGTWSARGISGGPLEGRRMGGTFTGTFRLPFAMPQVGPAYMLNPFDFPKWGSFVPVAPEEQSLGVPTVRLELSFVDVPGAAKGHD
jgi:hypothetical protein